MQKQKQNLTKIFSAAAGLFVSAFAGAQSAFGQWNPGSYTGTGLPYRVGLGQIIANIAYWILGIFGFVAIIGFVISGITYLVSAGDEDTQERAKRAMMYSITGVIVGLVGLVVVYAVDYFLGGTGGGAAVVG